MTHLRHHFGSRRALRRTQLFVLLLAGLGLLLSATALASEPVIPSKTMDLYAAKHWITYDGRPAGYVVGFRIWGTAGENVSWGCYNGRTGNRYRDCPTRHQTIRASHPSRDSLKEVGLNYVVPFGWNMWIEVSKQGYRGRYLVVIPGSRNGRAGWYPSHGCLVPGSGVATTCGYMVYTAAVGSGAGTITGSGISCPSTCITSANTGSTVTLTATPASGSWFTGWSGACSGTGVCRVQAKRDVYVLANFTRMYKLFVGTTGSGNVTGSGISCPGTCVGMYPAGAQVTIYANPAAGYVFTGWTGACSGTGSCTMTLKGDALVAATFAPAYTLSVAVNGSGVVNGSLACGGHCSVVFASGSTVTLNVTPRSGYVFSGWSGACTGTGSCSVVMNTNESVTATFTAVYTLSVSVSGSGSVTGSGINCPGTCSATYNAGTSVGLSANPGSSYSFGGWGGACGGTGGCTVTMNGNESVSAGFNYNAPPEWNETVGGVTNTWTNYSNAGGNEGAQIAKYQTVLVSCKVQGFKVADGDTWWYRIFSSPWNNAYYASADAFYNNGATSGSLSGTPFVDGAVANC